MLLHHSPVPYQAAASEAARYARSKLERLIAGGQARARAVLEAVEAQRPIDRLVRAAAVEFAVVDGDLRILLGGESHGLHEHALQQVTAKAGMPWTFVQHLREAEQAGWGPQLLVHNLNELFRRQLGQDVRFLVRSVEGEVRGFLSDRFRRLDTRPIVGAFLATCGELGAVPIESYISDVRVGVKVLLPMVFEPVEHEVMAVGLLLSNSDVGAGSLSVRAFVVRLMCTNFAITTEALREVHLGGRLADDMRWSEETMVLDTARMVSAVNDVVRGELGHARIDALLAAVRRADAEHVEPRHVGLLLRKSLGKAEIDDAVTAFNTADVELVPAGPTRWRLSNCVSLLAGRTSDIERKVELMKLAGQLLYGGAGSEGAVVR